MQNTNPALHKKLAGATLNPKRFGFLLAAWTFHSYSYVQGFGFVVVAKYFVQSGGGPLHKTVGFRGGQLGPGGRLDGYEPSCCRRVVWRQCVVFHSY